MSTNYQCLWNYFDLTMSRNIFLDFKIVATTCFALDQEHIFPNLSRVVLLDEFRSICKEYSASWSSLHMSKLLYLVQIFFFCFKNFGLSIHVEVCSSVSAYFIKRTQTRARTFKKTDPWPLENADSMPKFTVLAKNSFFTNSRVLLSSDNSFSRLRSLKHTKIEHFWSQIKGFFIFAQKFAIWQVRGWCFLPKCYKIN